MFGFVIVNEVITKLFVLFTINIIVTYALRKIVEQHGKQLFYLLLLHLAGWAIAAKIVAPGIPLKFLLLFLVLSTISGYIHELGHVVTWALMGVRLVKADIIPMLAFGVLPDLSALSRLKPRAIMLAAMMGPLFNLACALAYEWFGKGRWGEIGQFFTWINYMNFVTNILPSPFTDGTHCVVRIFRHNSKVLIVMRNMLLYTALTSAFFLPVKVTALCLGLLAVGLMIGYATYWVYYHKYQVVEIDTTSMEIMLSVCMGIAIVFGYIFMGDSVNKLANSYGPTLMYMIRSRLGW